MTISTFEILRNVIIWAPGMVLAIVLHEWAHGYAAHLLGDPTPAAMGRLTLNPLPHIDWMWTIVLPIAMLITSLVTTGHPFVFGGAKPVPINPRYFRGNPRLAMLFVAAAGPLINLTLALICALLVRELPWLPRYFMIPLALMLIACIQMNVLLAVFNLLPLPPLDGGRIAVALLPHPLDRTLASLERFGLPIVLVLAFSGLLGTIIGPAMNSLNVWFLEMAGI